MPFDPSSQSVFLLSIRDSELDEPVLVYCDIETRQWWARRSDGTVVEFTIPEIIAKQNDALELVFDALLQSRKTTAFDRVRA